MIGGILIGFLTALLYCAIVILVAFLFVWGLKFIGVAIDGDVLKWGKIVVGLICIIVMLTWLLSALGLLGGSYNRPFRILSGVTGTHSYYAHSASPEHLQRVLT